jgi:hypothetical protein
MKRHAAAVALFVAVLAIGLAVHADFGVPWDEPIQRSYGRTVTNYVFKGEDGLFADPNRVYGSAYEVALLAFERVRQARDGPEIFAARHLFNFLTFWVSLIFLYRLALRGSRSRLAGLLVCLALVLSPTLFGHAFFNSKDLPFLSAFVIAVWSLVRMLERPTVPRSLVHAVASGWLIAVRIPGILILALTAAGVIYCVLRAPDLAQRRRRLITLGVYAIASSLCVWMFWPTLWRAPIASFWHALQTMSRYPWDQMVLYRGALVPATDLPWHYAPVWIAITTPLAYLAAFGAGVPATVRQWLSERRRPEPSAGAFQVVVLGWLLGPVLSVIGLGSVLYDAWRQLFFIYPALLLIAMQGVVAVARAARERWPTRSFRLVAIAAAALAIGDVAGVLRFMIRSHPHSHVYFNALVGGIPGARFRYELDYWGVSYRAGLEAMLRHDRGALIPYFAEGAWSAQALPFPDRRRLMDVKSIDHAKYFLGAYRSAQAEYPFPDVIHRVEVSGVPILIVALIRPELAMTTLSAPEVVDVLERNASRDSGGRPASRAAIDAGLRTWLERFVRHARRLDIGITGTDEQLRRGRLEQVTIRIEDAEAGDFQSGKPGVPVAVLELAVDNAVIDLAQLAGGDLRVAHADEGRVTALELDAGAINRSLQARSDDLRRLRIGFDNGLIKADWQESTPMQALIRFWSGPDPWKPDSENLMFEIEEFRVSGWRVPGAGLLPWLGGISSPLISPDRVRARIRIGPVRIADGKLRIGS